MLRTGVGDADLRPHGLGSATMRLSTTSVPVASNDRACRTVCLVSTEPGVRPGAFVRALLYCMMTNSSPAQVAFEIDSSILEVITPARGADGGSGGALIEFVVCSTPS